MRLVVLCVLVTLTAGCANVNDGLGRGPPCELAASGELLLRGSTAAPMLACVKAIGDAPVSRVVVDSNGGPVDAAIEIAELLARHDAEFVVRGQCNSSCANYFLPIARRITVEPGSVAIIHGSIDEATLAGAARAGGDVSLLQRQHEAQRAYIDRHGIHLGWLMTRTPDERARGDYGAFLTGQIGTPFSSGDVNAQGIVVEESLMRSCLNGVEITPFKDTPAQRIYSDESLARTFAKQGLFPSGSLVCSHPIESNE